MKPAAIDTSRIESMVAQLKATAARAQGSTSVTTSVEASATKLNFSDALKASLDQVNATQGRAIEMGQQFALGDDRVSLSDVMIAGQKSSIAFQATVQTRNKLVSAYQDIMNMQV